MELKDVMVSGKLDTKVTECAILATGSIHRKKIHRHRVQVSHCQWFNGRKKWSLAEHWVSGLSRHRVSSY
jgi:hypothetical protein